MAPRKENANGADEAHEESHAVPTAEFTVPEGWASVLFDRAFQLAEEYSANIKARKANRESLRNLKAQGLLSTEEEEMLAELYPDREIHRRTDEERAAELEEQAQKVRERAAQKAAEAEAAKAAA